MFKKFWMKERNYRTFILVVSDNTAPGADSYGSLSSTPPEWWHHISCIYRIANGGRYVADEPHCELPPTDDDARGNQSSLLQYRGGGEL